jgi:hypothetical protein
MINQIILVMGQICVITVLMEILGAIIKIFNHLLALLKIHLIVTLIQCGLFKVIMIKVIAHIPNQ